MTNCYTYEVTMILQVLEEDEDSAKEKLDKDGGYVTKRDVKLLETTTIINAQRTYCNIWGTYFLYSILYLA